MSDPFVLFGKQFGAAVRKVRVAAEVVGIRVNLVPASRGGADPAFRAVSPGGVVPALRHGEARILGSMAILNYLQWVSGTSTLLPEDSNARIEALSLCHVVDGPLARMTSVIFQNSVLMPRFEGKPGNTKAVKRIVNGGLPRLLGILEGLNSSRPPNLDVATISIFSQIIVVPMCGIELQWADYPTLTTIMKEILAVGGVSDMIYREFLLAGTEFSILDRILPSNVGENQHEPPSMV